MNNNSPNSKNASTTSNFIVFLNDNPGQGNLAAKVDALLKSLGESGKPVELFENLGNAFVLNITEKQANRLRALGGPRSEVAVIGVEDRTWGEAVAAVVALKGDAEMTVASLKAWCEGELSAYKIPKKLLVLDTLPRNAMGKVVKPSLKALFN